MLQEKRHNLVVHNRLRNTNQIRVLGGNVALLVLEM